MLGSPQPFGFLIKYPSALCMYLSECSSTLLTFFGFGLLCFGVFNRNLLFFSLFVVVVVVVVFFFGFFVLCLNDIKISWQAPTTRKSHTKTEKSYEILPRNGGCQLPL